jgi:hypothetical protein
MAGSHSAESNVTTVDTRGELRSVSGRVVAAKTLTALPGVSVAYSGSTRTTDSGGRFAFEGGTWPNGQELTASKVGYVTARKRVEAPSGAQDYVVPDVALATGYPMVVGVEGEYEGLFLAGVAVENEYTATVEWGSGHSPGSVEFSSKARAWKSTVATTGTEASITEDVNALLVPSLVPGANAVVVVAIDSDGNRSDPYLKEVGLLPMPGPLGWVASRWPFTAYVTGQVGVDWDIPDPPIERTVTLPVLGKFGVEMGVNLSFDYTFTDGSWEAAVGFGAEGKQGKRGRRPSFPGLTRYPKLKLYIGNKEISGKIEGGAQGTATLSQGFTFDEVLGRVEIEVKLELGRYGLADLLGPGLSTALSKVPGLEKLTRNTSVIIWVIPGVEGEATWSVKPSWAFKEVEATGKIGLEASYEPNVGFGKARVFIGGEPSLTLQYPGDLFKELRFKAYAGFESQIWVFNLGPVEFVFVDYSWPSRVGLNGLQGLRGIEAVDGGWRIPVRRAGSGELHPVSRDYLAEGPERFVAGPGEVAPAGGAIEDALERFRRLGRGEPDRGAGLAGGGRSVGLASAAQADLPLVQNVFPFSEPALAGRTNQLMLLYVSDPGTSADLQRTDIRWTRYDGTNWSEPGTILADTRAEFAPQVRYDGNGDAVAVWERVAQTNFNQVDLSAMAAQMEIVWARWDRTTGQWSEPVGLTENGSLDHAPLLAGPLADGSLLATWTANAQDLLMGTNGAPSQVLWARWNPSIRSWTAPETLLGSVPNRLSQSLAAAGDRAVYVWTQDLDGDVGSEADQQVFSVEWNTSAWGSPAQRTAGAEGNRNARVALAANGDAYLFWQQGTNLVMNRNLSGAATVVRSDSQTAGFADYALTLGPGGNLVLVWQEMSTDGSDAHYRVYDPASDTWSRDERLFRDAPLERSFVPVWDDIGSLTLAYNRVEILKVNKTVTVEGGQSITITNVPQSGRVDLAVTKRRLVRDVALASGDFTVQGVNYLPGDPLTLAARIRNAGDLALTNVAVAFYSGDPQAGGTLLTNVLVTGWLDGAATNTVQAQWIVPEPAAPYRLYAVASATGDSDSANNTHTVSIGGTDLEVSLMTHSAGTNGTLRVVAQVRNWGAPAAPACLLAIRRAAETNAPLASRPVPALLPGRLAQVALDLPEGTQPQGEALYELNADDTAATADIDRANNRLRFSVNLWIDSDKDGMPDGWEREHGFNPSDPGDAAEDRDHDGMSNLGEYRAGTSPTDPMSYLQVQSIRIGEMAHAEIAWGSTPNRLYTIQRSANVPGGFTNIVEHVLATPPENRHLDTSAPADDKAFYRVLID